MRNRDIDIIKANGERVKFSSSKLKKSLIRSGADASTVSSILEEIGNELYPGISTKEVYNRAFALLKSSKGAYASRYKLKKAIYELGPTGYPFEKYIGRILESEAYEVLLNQIVKGKCVQHEVDVVAIKDSFRNLIECKFHSEEGRNCDVKIPLYIHARFQDIHEANTKHTELKESPGWVVTNTRFTQDAKQYGKCKGLNLLSWDYPKNNSLKKRIDEASLYPITVSTLLSQNEKQFLLNNNIVLGSELIKNAFFMDHLGISEKRKKRIIGEFKMLCSKSHKNEE